MLNTRITQMLGIDYPIIQGGMQWLGRAQLASAVSNAGGLGVITALSLDTTDDFRDELRRMRDMTDRPFGVNISMLPVMTSADMTQRLADIVCEEAVPVVETAGRSPEPIVGKLKAAGVKLMHKVPAVRFAKKAQAVGADAVIVVGFECGGHPGLDDVPSLILVPKAAAELDIPVIAAGGFCDGCSLAAALALGAEGVLMGTRFMACAESPIHDSFKQWFVEAQETQTVVIERSIKNAARVMNNDAAQQVVKMEAEGASLNDLLTVIAGKFGREAYLSGDLNAATIACGQVVGRIDAIKTAKEIIDDTVREARQTADRLAALFAS